MPAIDFSQLKKLPPEMRIKALQKLEEQITKLIQHRQKAIEQSQKEIEEAQRLLEEAKHELRILEEIETPKIKPVEVEKLFAKEEETKEPEKQQIKELEKIASEEPRRITAEQESYARFIAERMSIEQIYNKAKDIQNEQKKTGIETFYQQNFLTAAERAIDFKREAEEKGIYNPSRKSEMLMDPTEKLIKYLKGESESSSR
ncbi:MAG: hypothetical protein QW666_00125 [Candidatus Woesearchaeota archaeon]